MMEERATEGQVMGLIARLDRVGHYLTPRAVAMMHDIISRCEPDTRTEGSQRDLASYVRDRIKRDKD